MRLTPEVLLIGSGQLGFNLTDPLDCHVYAVDGGDEIAIIDAGLGRQTERLLTILEADGLDRRRISTIVLTHAHGDHAGGLARLQAQTGARVVVPAEAAPWVAAADEAKISLDRARAIGMYPRDYRWQPCPVDQMVVGGDVVRVGRLALRTIDTPGHARGHCSYLMEGQTGRTLFAGDLVFWGGRVSLQNIWDCSIQDLAASLAKLSGLDVTALLPGHGLLSLTEGQSHIDRAVETMRRLGVPPNLS